MQNFTLQISQGERTHYWSPNSGGTDEVGCKKPGYFISIGTPLAEKNQGCGSGSGQIRMISADPIP